MNQENVIFLYVICKINSYYFKLRQSNLQVSSKTFKFASAFAHNRAIYEIVYMNYHFAKIDNTRFLGILAIL